MLLRTTVAEELRKGGLELVIVAPNADEPYFRQEFDRPGYTLVQAPARPSDLERVLVDMRIYFLMNPKLGITLNHKRERFRQYYPVRYAVSRGANVVLGNIPALRRAYLAIESRIYNGSEFDALLREHQPDLVITGTPGFNVVDAHLLRAARRHHLRTATVALSWDNLTSKGYMSAQPEELLVWNDLMRDEAVRYHDFAGAITEVGAAQFDVYASVDAPSTQEFRRRHGVPEDCSLIVWGTINEAIYPNQLDLLRRFIDRFQTGGGPRFLWIRAHPQSVHGPHADLIPSYEALTGPNVHVELPPVVSTRLAWDLPSSDLHHLAQLLTAADVVVTPQSTLSIDAACAGTPVVNLPVTPDMARAIDYTHYRNVTKHGAVWLAHDLEELLEAVDAYIADPSLHAAGRQALVLEQMGAWFGKAGQRTAQVLLDLASASPRPRWRGEN